MHKKFLIFGAFFVALFGNIFADNMLVVSQSMSEADKKEHILLYGNDKLVLKKNQTLVVNHLNGNLLYILEITDAGGVKKIDLPPKFRGRKESKLKKCTKEGEILNCQENESLGSDFDIKNERDLPQDPRIDLNNPIFSNANFNFQSSRQRNSKSSQGAQNSSNPKFLNPTPHAQQPKHPPKQTIKDAKNMINENEIVEDKLKKDSSFRGREWNKRFIIYEQEVKKLDLQ